MDMAIQILVGVLGLPLVVLGARIMFAPAGMLGELGVEAPGPVGLNTVRGAVGGLLLSSAVMIGLGLALHDTVWFLAVAVVMGVAAFGRLAGVLMDGFDKAVVRPIVIEVVIAGVMVLAHLRLAGVH